MLLVIIDISLGSILKRFFLRMKTGESARKTYSLNKANQELIIFGSSRASHHYIPSIFKDSLQFTSYNTGTDGQSMLYYHCILKSILKRSKPKMVILDINNNEFIQSQKHYERLSSLLPYYKDNKEIRPIINLKSKYEKFKTYSNLYRYNSYLLTIIANNLLRREEKDTMNGYIPLNGIWGKSINDTSYLNETQSIDIDSTKVNSFKEFIRETKNTGCTIQVLVSPTLLKYNTNSSTVRIAKTICKQYEVNFMDYSQDSDFLKDPELFKDPSHLNHKGATKYTKKIASYIINNKPL